MNSVLQNDGDDVQYEILRINIFDIDFYTGKPNFLHDKTYSIYRGLNAQVASVVRIFGSTDNGIKVCLHLHQYFPHLSLRAQDLARLCGVSLDETIQGFSHDIPNELMATFIVDLESEMRKSFNRFKFQDQPDRFNEDEHFVYTVEPIVMKPIYGYHENEELFYQFKFYSNWMAEAAKTILQKGFYGTESILVYNHLEFLLQFYVDNQIYLNVLQLDSFTVRKKKVQSPGERSDVTFFREFEDQRSASLKLDSIESNSLRTTSSCFLECDSTLGAIIPSTHPKKYPEDLFFTPSLPGIINLWNDHFARSQKRNQDFRRIVDFLDNKVPRKYSIDDPIHLLNTRFLKKYISSGQRETREFTPSQTPTSSNLRDENEANIENLEEEFEFDPWLENDMMCTQEELDLRDDDFEEGGDAQAGGEANDEEDANPSLLDLDLDSDLENSRSPIKTIPQFDGHNSSGSESGDNIDDITILNTAGVSQSEILDLDFDLNSATHSTPVSSKQSRPVSAKRRSARSSLKRFRDTFQIDTIDEDNVSIKFRKSTKGVREQLSFNVSSQRSPLSQGLADFELSSVMSNTSASDSFDGMTMEIANTVEWNQCFELTIMSMELHCKTRADLLPNPTRDPIRFVMFSVFNEIINESQSSFQLEVNTTGETMKFSYIGALVVDSKALVPKKILRVGHKNIHVTYVGSEAKLLTTLASYVQTFDPEILSGIVVDTLSWGYLLQRAAHLKVDVLHQYSRIFNSYQARGNSAGGINKCPQLVGRVIMNVWYLMRKELNLRGYTFENVCYNLLRERVPKLPNDVLNRLWESGRRTRDELSRDRVLEYYLVRVINQIKMLVQSNVVRRIFDLSCLFGMPFQDALTRGTQFRVESILLPLAKLENFIPVRFTREIVDAQNAAEEIPLVLEPQSSLHTEPVAVLDFQSLYPSVMIAHNFCFTTCLGKVKNIVRGNPTLGCHKLNTEPEIWEKLKDDVDVAPNGSVFVKPNVRRGLLSKMLQDLLYTRILVKNELKEAKARLSDATLSTKFKQEMKSLERKLDNCQLGLKLIANVTYGYTSANMSGRMPCVDLADAIVSKGREALERAILFINRWGESTGTNAKVVYGDTDSVFISYPGTTIEKAFEYSAVLAQEITAQNLYPMAIKVEKVYSPCFLFAKKRYCGMAYEALNKKPFFDAKGIETVRRDNCPIVSKILRKSIDILFENAGSVDQLKPYLQWQMKKILNGRHSNLTDFVFAKEFWGLEFYTNTTVMPSCIIAKQWIDSDPMAVAKTKQRIPYVIVAGSAKDRLADLVRDPKLFLLNSSLRINAPYYIQRAIFPPLVRALEAIPGFDPGVLMAWYEEVRHFKTKKVKIMNVEPTPGEAAVANVVHNHFKLHICALCGARSRVKLCPKCSSNSQTSLVTMFDRLKIAQVHLDQLTAICSGCSGVPVSSRTNSCVALDCNRLFQFHQAAKDFDFVARLNTQLANEFRL